LLSLFATSAHRFTNVRSDHLPGVEIVRAHHSGPPVNWQFVPMVRISCLLSGRARIWSHGEGAVIDPGKSVVNAPGCMPRIVERLTETTDTITAYVAPLLYDSLASACGGPCARQLEVHLVHDPLLTAALHRLASAIERRASAPALHRLLAALVKASSAAVRDPSARAMPGGPLRPEIAQARRIIQDRFARAISLHTLSEEVGLSKFHLLRLFRQEVGTTPHAYQLHLRIARAREMLDAHASAAEVALACGFADQAHFTRAFKRIVGYTPGAFQRFALTAQGAGFPSPHHRRSPAPTP
jgi:AraC-like DNA-binding protein